MGVSGPSRANKFLYAPAPPPPSVWALKPPLWALVHKTTFASMIFTALCICFGCLHIHYFGKWERVGPWDSRVYWVPNGTCLLAQCHFTGPKKLLNSRAQPPPTCPRNGYAHIQNIMHGAV
jgi:hypothetical protein